MYLIVALFLLLPMVDCRAGDVRRFFSGDGYEVQQSDGNYVSAWWNERWKSYEGRVSDYSANYSGWAPVSACATSSLSSEEAGTVFRDLRQKYVKQEEEEKARIEQEKVKFTASLRELWVQRSSKKKWCHYKAYRADGTEVWARKDWRDDECSSDSPSFFSDADLYKLMEEIFYEQRGGRREIVLSGSSRFNCCSKAIFCCAAVAVVIWKIMRTHQE